MVSGADVGGEDLAGNKPGRAVRAELVEEGGEVVERLEGLGPVGRGRAERHVVPLAPYDDVADEQGQEANTLAGAAAVPGLVAQGRGEVVAEQGDEAVEDVPLLLDVRSGLDGKRARVKVSLLVMLRC